MTTTTQLMTAEELMELEGPNRHELIKGELLTMPPPKFEHGRTTANLTALIGLHVKANELGVVCAHGGYKLESNPDTVLGPDVSFVAKHRVAHPEGYYLGPPDLAVEVMFPSDRKPRLERKARMWLSFGAKSVWIVNPRQQTVEIMFANDQRKLFREKDELVDGTIPGLHFAVSEIFDYFT